MSTKPFTGWEVRGWPILEKYDEERQVGLQIYGDRYNRGTSPIAGNNTMQVGYRLSCTACDWSKRINAPLKEARIDGREHAREVHGVRGMEAV